MSSAKVIWTKIDEAPALATYSLLPIVESYMEDSGVEIIAHPFDSLLINCAHDVGASIIVRGLRAVADFEYEYQMVGMNRVLDDRIETVFLMADAEYQAIASKLVKEIARLGGDVSSFVTPEVDVALKARFSGG